MSVFQVVLNNGVQGNLDVLASTATAGGVGIVDTVSSAPAGVVTAGTLPSSQSVAFSLQRTVYIMGPRKINREIKDGTTFTDCNYWKRYCDAALTIGGGATAQTAILRCIYDDGTVWSDDQSENAYPKAALLFPSAQFNAYVSTAAYPTTPLPFGATNGPDTFNITATFGQPAYFCSISNNQSSFAQAVQVRLNGDNGCIFTIPGSQDWIFNQGDCQIASIEVAYAQTTGATGTTITTGLSGVLGTAAPVAVVVGIRSIANS